MASLERSSRALAFEVKCVNKAKALLESTKFPGFIHYESMLRKVLAEEILVLDPSSEERREAELQLARACSHSGFSDEDSTMYMNSLFELKGDECRRIVLKIAKRLEQEEHYETASQLYLEANEFTKSAELMLKASWLFSGTNHHEEKFLAATEVLIQGGENKANAYGKMAQIVMKEIRRDAKEVNKEIHGAEKDGGTYTGYGCNSDLFYVFGECLYHSGKKDESMIPFKEMGNHTPYDMRPAVSFLEEQNDLLRALEIQKLVAEANPYDDAYVHLADLHSRLGQKKEQANALWMAGKKMEAARLAYSITRDRSFFLKAAEYYNKKKSGRERTFFDNVWGLSQFWELSKKGNSWELPDPNSITEKKRKMEALHNLFSFVCIAYSLPVPPKIDELVFAMSRGDHRQKAKELGMEFKRRKELTKSTKRSIKSADNAPRLPGMKIPRKRKEDLTQLLSEPILFHALSHACLAGEQDYDIRVILRSAFLGLPRKRPVESTLPPKLLEMWRAAVTLDQPDPVEMAGRAYEEGEYYKEAHERYLKANLFEDAKRMEQLMRFSKKNAEN